MTIRQYIMRKLEKSRRRYEIQEIERIFELWESPILTEFYQALESVYVPGIKCMIDTRLKAINEKMRSEK